MLPKLFIEIQLKSVRIRDIVAADGPPRCTRVVNPLQYAHMDITNLLTEVIVRPLCQFPILSSHLYSKLSPKQSENAHLEPILWTTLNNLHRNEMFSS